MEVSKEVKKKRPLSHIQLLVIPNDSEYIMDNPKEFLKEPQRKEKFSLENLHEKWKRKGIVNFNKIDIKFDVGRTRPVKSAHRTEEDEIQQKQFFDILHGIHYDPCDYIDNNDNKSQKSYIKKNSKSKYNSKNSYYLTAKNPWNNNSVFDIKDKKEIDKQIIKNVKEANKANELINNQNKNYKSIRERYLRNNYLIKQAKKNKFIEEESNRLYNKVIFENPGLEKYPEKINALVFKGMINLYEEYSKYIEEKKNKKVKKNKAEKINKFHLDEIKFRNKNLRSKHIFTDIEIFEKLQILLAYLKESKEKIDQKKFLQLLLLDYNKVIEKEEYLKKIDEDYQKYIEERRKEEELEKKNINSLTVSKYPINEKIEKEKIRDIFSYHKIEIEDPNQISNKNKNINYFLTAYKTIFDENSNLNKLKKKAFPVVITERSTNPYGTLDNMRNKRDKKDEEIKNNEINLIQNKIIKKRPKSSYGTRHINITYYHPGSYYLFKEGNNEFNAWSCCLNENKFSRGCSKKIEKVLGFQYNDNILH